MDSIIHLSSEVDKYILFSLYCAYTYEVVNQCCEVVFYSSLHGCVQWALTLAMICLRANSEPHMLVCLLQVNDVRLEPTMESRIGSMLLGCHWSRTVSLHARAAADILPTMSPSYYCQPQLRPAIPVPGHVPELLLPAITPTSFCWRGLWQCCGCAGCGFLRLMLDDS
jgi:hypothetical protein